MMNDKGHILEEISEMTGRRSAKVRWVWTSS